MVIVPIDVRCNYCPNTFCCQQCRIKHESSKHEEEINQKIRQEYLRQICHICRGEPFPVHISNLLSSELIQHLQDEHLPLKCQKCCKIFENINDFQLIGKCCSLHSEQESIDKENMGENLPVENEAKVTVKEEQVAEENMTPMSKINLRWRRKSKEFLHKTSEDLSHVKTESQQVKRQTSTPNNQGILFDSISSMQFSSINCVSSSSETDLSPDIRQSQNLAPPSLIPLSPKSIKKKKGNSPLSKTRSIKKTVQNTPLRQVMTKSIQRAMQVHGHYKHVNLQQRKMTFDSSSSSNEPTISLMKIQVETEEYHSTSAQPLDLRLSPALRRCNNDQLASNDTMHVKYKQVQVLRRCESENSSLSFKSCYSDVAGFNATPKCSSGSILKKTISFETIGCKSDQTSELLMLENSYDNKNDEDENSDIFYTPRSTPMRRRVKSLDLTDSTFEKSPGKPAKKLWNFVTSVMGSLVSNKNEQKSPGRAEYGWKFNLENPLKSAANYFGKYAVKDKDFDASKEKTSPSNKRPRAIITSPPENSENFPLNPATSPICKRRKIQGRKPIERMRSFV